MVVEEQEEDESMEEEEGMVVDGMERGWWRLRRWRG